MLNVASPPEVGTVYVIQIRRIGEESELVRHPPRSTDIIVHGGRPKHFVRDRLIEHHEAHKNYANETMVTLRAGLDEIVWVADAPFALVQIKAADEEEPHVPFELTLPVCSGPSRLIRTGKPIPHKEERRYKATFAIDNELIDPDFTCTPP